jgi:energy-coupling factor transporter ATP-binding protein EcfA2
MSSLVFQKVQVSQFGGIDRDKPIIIQFPPSKTKKRKIVKITGDQGMGKSSLLNCLLYLSGHKFDYNLANLANLASNAIVAEEQFERNGFTWKVRVTRTKFEVFRLFRAGKEEGWIPQSSPNDLVRDLIGQVAVSPMKLAVDDGQKQVEWLLRMLNVPEEVINEKNRFSDALKEIEKSRADANRQYVFLQKKLSEDPLFRHWEVSAKKYAKPKSVDAEKKKFEAATRLKEKYYQHKKELQDMQDQIAAKADEITELHRLLEKAEAEKAALEERAKQTLQAITGLKDAETAFDAAYKDFSELTTYTVQYNAWQQVKQEKMDMESFETVVQQFDEQKRKLKEDRRGLLKKLLPPDIDGLEIQTEDNLDGKKTGVYLHGRNPIQLSESELFDLYFKLCEFQGVTMIVIDNISSFGTNVINTLNALAKKGVYIWATEMRRGQDELKIEFLDELN